MKRFLSILLCTLISIGVYSQRIVNMEKCRTAYNEHYTKVTVFNSSYSHYIVCIVFAMDYWSTNGNAATSTITFSNLTFAPIANSSVRIFKKPDDCGYIFRFYVKRVIFDNGKYIDFK